MGSFVPLYLWFGSSYREESSEKKEARLIPSYKPKSNRCRSLLPVPLATTSYAPSHFQHAPENHSKHSALRSAPNEKRCSATTGNKTGHGWGAHSRAAVVNSSSPASGFEQYGRAWWRFARPRVPLLLFAHATFLRMSVTLSAALSLSGHSAKEGAGVGVLSAMEESAPYTYTLYTLPVAMLAWCSVQYRVILDRVRAEGVKAFVSRLVRARPSHSQCWWCHIG